MNSRNVFALAVAPAVLVACNSEVSRTDEAVAFDLDQPIAEATASSEPPPPAGAQNDINDGYPDLTPAELTPEAERTEKGARNLILSFGRALELREWDQAWEMLADRSKVTWSSEEWSRMFADLTDITVEAPPGRMEGAAGSSFYSTDLTITANGAEGRPIRYEGKMILRRANDIPGASAADLRWHIYDLTLDATH
ncbi:hypothetical protein [Qipengyuania atrilutea]|uniref:Lipoprotein n=1 Tax=Qipengyuania atrilutea TaxID=2744473 RepID=A0A850H7F6_9SPHN|nr:hypothetical protein [Actirhodobacter atriluteus]NVD45778.1 hypothetical protein [Actirhodobacter atriluteus]